MLGTQFGFSQEVTKEEEVELVENEGGDELDGEIFTIVEKMPEYPGGQDAMYKYLSENIEFPQQAKSQGIEGIVYVTFVVSKNGSVKNVRILRGIGGGCDEEALRVIKKMPKWSPGKQRGRSVNVQYNIPIKFISGKKNKEED